MEFKPSDFYLNAFEFFSALVPGAVGTYIIWGLLKHTTIASGIASLSDSQGWIAFGIASLILGYAVQQPSHILNILYNHTYKKYRRRKGDPLLKSAISQAEKEFPDISETGSVYEWARTKVQAKEPSIDDSVGKIQGISKMFRSLSLFALIGMLSALWLQRWYMALGLFVLAILFFLVFSERRLTASSFVYQRLIELQSNTTKKRRFQKRT